jgi:hypothetical protein
MTAAEQSLDASVGRGFSTCVMLQADQGCERPCLIRVSGVSYRSFTPPAVDGTNAAALRTARLACRCEGLPYRGRTMTYGLSNNPFQRTP